MLGAYGNWWPSFKCFTARRRQISLTIRAWNDSSKMLTGKPQIKARIRGKVAGEVSRCVAFAREVKDSLEDAGWRPKDMIGRSELSLGDRARGTERFLPSHQR